MDIDRHLHFCPQGSPYFDLPARHSAEEGNFALAREELPPGWTRGGDTEWLGITAPDARLPLQGWKIHVSATPDNAERILATVAKYCLADGLTFKFIRSPQILAHRNGKYGDRSASGKFITMYPLDEAHLARVLEELGALLDGEEGPYILSDLRWRKGPLYVRYGGFVSRTVRGRNGELVHCIEDLDGNLVPDHRGPGFRPPPWVTLPDCLTEALAARNAGTLTDFPYRVTAAVHFSNGGGVYRGSDTRTGKDVLLREARPLAGLVEGTDAVARQRQEHWALERTAGLDCVPEVLDYRQGNEHWFLVRDWVEGEPLAKLMLHRNPLTSGSADPEDFAAYARWAQQVLAHIERGITQLHQRGVVFADLHPSNVLVRPDDTVAFIDFETARATDSDAPQTLGAAGFTAPHDRTGPAIDRYALGCLRLAVFVPLPTLLIWGPEKAEHLIDAVTSRFPLPADYADLVRRDLGLTAPAEPTPPADWPAAHGSSWESLRTEIAEGILATATPDREDRLFPGDPEQFFTPEGAAALANGSAGVLWALSRTGTEVPQEHVDWTVAKARSVDSPRPGFYDGLAGVAYALLELQRPEEAVELLGRALEAYDASEGEPGEAAVDDTLLSGTAGLGLTLLHFASVTGERAWLERALALAAPLLALDAQSSQSSQQSGEDGADGAGTDPRAAEAKRRFGLLRGPSGRGLFLLRLYEATGDRAYLDGAEYAVRQDLDHAGWTGTELPPEAPGRLPLLGLGTGGTAMLLHDLLRHLPDADTDASLVGARDAVAELARHQFLPQGGLFHGRAGELLALLHLSGVGMAVGGGAGAASAVGAGDGDGADPAVRTAILRQARDFALQAVPDEERTAFLGHESLKISTDLATGGAGVLLALDAAFGDRGATLPFFGASAGASVGSSVGSSVGLPGGPS
ncbi:protein kinase/lanthionine synthetase C family protein [Streptomyces sp. NA04227]|uniref:class III lanthionine synthetase LanKC n=1 Tax=Streptomyces sp. NA04227 TaxID=2742136 RepID=UPI00159214FB|nr:class III lanthionine synthetase LanKC [Streptomyces sp. NA04227]QKW08020.1 protein kinase/lanthionine synthetase C family protein [Streptomyces sp. NA04227]